MLYTLGCCFEIMECYIKIKTKKGLWNKDTEKFGICACESPKKALLGIKIVLCCDRQSLFTGCGRWTGLNNEYIYK